MSAASRKRVTAVIAILGAIALSTAAYAYWTQGGSGTGTATTGDAVDLSVAQVTTLAAMYPGDQAQPITVRVSNPNAASIQVNDVTASIDTITGGGPTCEVTDYTLATPVMNDNPGQVPGSSGTPVTPGTRLFSGASIKFNNKSGEDQNDCKRATVRLKYTVG